MAEVYSPTYNIMTQDLNPDIFYFFEGWLVKTDYIRNLFIAVLAHIILKGVRRDEQCRRLPIQQHVAKTTISTSLKSPSF